MKQQAQDIVAVTVPVLLEVVAVIMFIGMAALWTGIAAGRI